MVGGRWSGSSSTNPGFSCMSLSFDICAQNRNLSGSVGGDVDSATCGDTACGGSASESVGVSSSVGSSGRSASAVSSVVMPLLVLNMTCV